MAFQSISTLIDPSRGKVPCIVVQPCSITSLVQSANAPLYQSIQGHHRTIVASTQNVSASRREGSHRALLRSRENSLGARQSDAAGTPNAGAPRWWLVPGVGSEEMRALKLLQDDSLTQSEESECNDSDV
jgi:hypothetical protein